MDSSPIVSGTVRRTIRNRWVFAAALVAVVAVWIADRWWLAGCFASLAAGAGLAGWAGWPRGMAAGLAGLAAAAVLHLRSSSTEEATARLLASAARPVVAVAMEEARGTVGAWSAQAKVVDGPVNGARILWCGHGEVPVTGSRLEARGSFVAPETVRNPGEFDRAGWMRRSGICAEFQPLGPTTVTTSPRAAWLAGLKRGFAESVVYGLEANSVERQVILAMVIGQHPRDADQLIADFRLSGTLHVFSVSGLHVAMVGGIVWWCAGMAGLARRHAVLILVPVMFGYAWITGNGAPAVRAACMAAIFLGAFVFRRKPDLLNSLGAVLLAGLLWDGRMLFHTGVQLSYGVVAAIALGMEPASRLFRWIADRDPYLPDDERSMLRRWWDGFRQWLAGSVAVSFAAALGSAPLTILHFGMMTPVSLLANLVLLPLVFGILCLGLAGAACYPWLPSASAWINRANGLLAQTSAGAAHAFASLPGGHLLTRRPGRPLLVVYDLPYGSMASVLADGRGEATLFDCGSRGGFRHTVRPSLESFGMRARSMILSHPDASHLGGGDPVWRSLSLEEVVLPVDDARSKVFQGWKGADHDGVRLRRAADTAWMHGPDGANWHRLHLPHAGASAALADDRVTVWRLDWRGWRILFTSDAGFATERDLLESGADVAAEVIVAGKHRRDHSLGDDFLSAVNPRVIVAKNADYPPEERHAPESIAAWRARGIRFLDKAQTGAVTLTVREEGDLEISGFLTPGPSIVLRQR